MINLILVIENSIRYKNYCNLSLEVLYFVWTSNFSRKISYNIIPLIDWSKMSILIIVYITTCDQLLIICKIYYYL